jgi:eukaryotic-like serine/threonine-protein kinase
VTASTLRDPFGLVGSTLDGQYRVDAPVGEGGFGVVYRGWHVSLDQPIAIKALKILDADDPRFQAELLGRFREEAKLLYTLSQASLNIVRSIDFGAVTTRSNLWAPYMVLEWLEGRSLAQDLDARRARGLRGRTLEESLELLAPVAEGLAVAHERRVAHRDVKPGNVFLVEGGASGPRVKVLDFGIAKILADDESGGTRSKFASFTWAYAAPEQLDPRLGQTGLATDVYSFALVLTELLTDREPIEARDVVTLMKAANDPLLRPTPRTRGAEVPDAVEHACRRALAVDPRARFATISELWRALERARSGRVRTSSLPRMTGPSASVTGSAAFASTQAAPPGAYAPPGGHAPSGGYAPAHPVTPGPMVAAPPVITPHGLPAYPAAPAPMVPTGRGHRPAPMPTGSGEATIIVTVVCFVLALLLAGSCALVHAAC